ncbi:MAG TPA: hypothetical protein PKL52_11245 [Tenuifilaceae bacterium]|nr:hypothetical protein [Tenuifilaceae bacterium]
MVAFHKLEIEPKGSSFELQLIFRVLGATNDDIVEYEFPSNRKTPFAVLPRGGEKILFWNGGQELINGVVEDVEWAIDLQSLTYSIFVEIKPFPIEESPGKTYTDSEREQWREDFHQAFLDTLGGRISNRAVNVVLRGARKAAMNNVPDVATAFMVGGRLAPFDGWANALLDGELTWFQLKAMGQMGIATMAELLLGLREWKKAR